MIAFSPSRLSIVSRLRFFLLLLFFLFVSTGLLLSYFLLRLDESQNSVVNDSIPSLVRAHFLESEFRELFVLIDRFASISTLPKIEASSSAAKNKLNSIKHVLSESDVFDDGPEKYEKIKNTLNELDKSIGEREKIKRLLISSQDDLASIRKELRSVGENMIDAIEPPLLDVTVELDSLLNQAPAIDNENISKLVNTVSQLSMLQSQTSSATDFARNLTTSYNSESTGEDLKQLQFLLQNATQTLIYLDYNDAKLPIAESTKKLYELSFSEGGIKRSLEIYHSSKAELEKAEIRESQYIDELSRWIKETVNTTIIQVSRSTDVFDRRLTLSLISMLIMSVLVSATVIFIYRVIIEEQINKRITKLTQSVLAIAAQDTEHEISVSGHDEIGKIAESLEIFRGNIIELQRSNNELQQFAYAASHDLRSPLRAISNLTEWVIEDTADILPEDSKKNLLLIRSRVGRLSTLLAALLEYSQAGMEESSISEINISVMVSEIADLLDPTDNYKVTCVGDTGTIETYWTPLNRVLTNLIGNAIKYHDKETGSITVSASNNEKWVTISVVDDGPGIDKQYHSDIFKLFVRLQSQDEVEGSGLGLSLVKRHIERFKAKINVISDPEKERGTTFRFTWPCHHVTHRNKIFGEQNVSNST